uniref:Uncharacterized protein n=1 Tax=Panagrolaimus sp. ES5 TaxID=591445 RepID=A0AC34FBZ7_9BILA
MSAAAWVITGGPFIGGTAAAARIIVAAYVAYLPLAGIQKKKPLYFIPYLFYLVILMICAGFAAFAFSSALKPEESELGFEVRKWITEFFELQSLTHEQIDEIILAFGTFAFVASLLSTWFFSVIYKCFKYISEINKTGYAKIVLPTTTSY